MLAADEDALVALESGNVLLEVNLGVGEGILEDGLLLDGDRQWVAGGGEAIALGEDNSGATIEGVKVCEGFRWGDLSDFCIEGKLPLLNLSDVRNRNDFTVILVFQ